MHLLEIPAELLQAELLSRLSLADWGRLQLTCTALRSVAQAAPDWVLLAAAGKPSTHPIHHSRSVRQYLAQQQAVRRAVAAGPDSWTWTSEPVQPELGGPVHPSPDRTRAAARRGTQLLLWDLQPSLRQTHCVEVGAAVHNPHMRVHFSSDGNVLAWTDTS